MKLLSLTFRPLFPRISPLLSSFFFRLVFCAFSWRNISLIVHCRGGLRWNVQEIYATSRTADEPLTGLTGFRWPFPGTALLWPDKGRRLELRQRRNWFYSNSRSIVGLDFRVLYFNYIDAILFYFAAISPIFYSVTMHQSEEKCKITELRKITKCRNIIQNIIIQRHKWIWKT